MMNLRPICVLIALCCWLSTMHASQAATQEGEYRFYWGGLRIGKIHLTLEEDGRQYRIHSIAKSSGLMRLFDKHKSEAFVRGVKRDGRYIPIQFRSEYGDGEEKNKLIELHYDSQGVVQSETLIPPRKESRPPVAQHEKGRGVLDIFTTIFAMQEQLANALAKGKTEFVAPIYDGKRRFDLQARIKDTHAIFEAQDQDQPAIALSLLRNPIAGYTQKELRKLGESNPEVTFYVHRDSFRLLGLAVPTFKGTLRAELQ